MADRVALRVRGVPVWQVGWRWGCGVCLCGTEGAGCACVAGGVMVNVP